MGGSPAMSAVVTPLRAADRGFRTVFGRDLVPPEHAAPHDFLIDRRNKAEAHTDDTTSAHYRFVAGDGREIQVGEPSRLTHAQLEELESSATNSNERSVSSSMPRRPYVRERSRPRFALTSVRR